MKKLLKVQAWEKEGAKSLNFKEKESSLLKKVIPSLVKLGINSCYAPEDKEIFINNNFF